MQVWLGVFMLSLISMFEGLSLKRASPFMLHKFRRSDSQNWISKVFSQILRLVDCGVGRFSVKGDIVLCTTFSQRSKMPSRVTYVWFICQAFIFYFYSFIVHLMCRSEYVIRSVEKISTQLFEYREQCIVPVLLVSFRGLGIIPHIRTQGAILVKVFFHIDESHIVWKSLQDL